MNVHIHSIFKKYSPFFISMYCLLTVYISRKLLVMSQYYNCKTVSTQYYFPLHHSIRTMQYKTVQWFQYFRFLITDWVRKTELIQFHCQYVFCRGNICNKKKEKPHNQNYAECHTGKQIKGEHHLCNKSPKATLALRTNQYFVRCKTFDDNFFLFLYKLD